MRVSNWTIFFLGASTSLLGACALPSTRESPADSPRASQIALVDYLGVLQTVEVEMGGRRLPFLFDSAGGATLLTPALADAIGCQRFGRATGFRHDGQRIDVPRCGPVELRVDGLSLGAEASVFDLMALMPPGAPELGGILSLHTLGQRPWTLDMHARTLTMESPQSLASRTAGMREIQVRPSTQGGGASLDLFMKVDAAQGELWLEIDSGNAAGLILSPHALAQLGIAIPKESPASVPVTLQISGFGAYTATAIVKDTIYDGLLDAAFLKAHRLTVDPASGKAWLEASAAR